jgi:hypothetical protein
MYKIFKIYSLLIFFSVSLIFSSIFVPNVKPLFADGIGIGIEGDIIPEMAQKAFIIWDEDEGEEVLVLNTSFGIDSLLDFSWIVPVQSEEDPEVRASNNEIFDLLEDIFAVDVRSDWNQYSSSYNYGSTSSGIEVIEIKEIGVYDLVIVWADDAETLTDWLEDNGYDVPNKFENIIEDYIEKYDECYFVVNKIDLNNEFSGSLDDLQEYSPGIYNDLMAEEIDSDDISDVIESLKYSIAQDIKDNKAYVANSFIGYILDQDDYEDLMEDWNNNDISSSELRNEVEERLTESELFETINELFQGAGTPIEITFSPDEPIFPLYITSLASNFGGVDVYFAGPYQVSDENNILTQWAYADLTSAIEEDLEDILDRNIPTDTVYITHLVYTGYMDDIADDSIFVRYSQSSGTTPYNPYYPGYPYYPTMNPYGYTMPYSMPMFSGYGLPSMLGGFSYNLPFGGSGLLGSTYGGIGGLYGTTFGGLYGGFSGGFSGLYGSGVYGGFSGTFGGLYGGGLYGGFSGTFGGLPGSSFYGGLTGGFGSLFGRSFFPGSTSILGGFYGSSFLPSYTNWPF